MLSQLLRGFRGSHSPTNVYRESMSNPSRIEMQLRNESLRLAAPFRISGYVFEESPVTVVTLRQDGHTGAVKRPASTISAIVPRTCWRRWRPIASASRRV